MPLLWPEALRVRLFSLKQARSRVRAGLPQRMFISVRNLEPRLANIHPVTLGESREYTAALNWPKIVKSANVFVSAHGISGSVEELLSKYMHARKDDFHTVSQSLTGDGITRAASLCAKIRAKNTSLIETK